MISNKPRQQLAHSGHIHSYAANRIVWDEGSDPNFTAILEAGYLRLQRYGIDGRRQILCLFTPGDFIGGPKSWGAGYSVAASVNAQLCRFDSRTFEQMVETDSDLRRTIYLLRSAKLDQLRWLTCLLGALAAEERLCAFLAVATKFMPCQITPEGGIILTLDLPRPDIADLLGTSVESISRITNRLDAIGVLKINDAREFEILDLPRLRVMGCLQGTLDNIRFPADFCRPHAPSFPPRPIARRRNPATDRSLFVGDPPTQ
ncbi:MAG: Crp/Fnr family transcriptional regulator [Sideroxyarcus sp.]|nr:Crp/Fnr family transcriptional regulator [Sideroxyarcus sp.]